MTCYIPTTQFPDVGRSLKQSLIFNFKHTQEVWSQTMPLNDTTVVQKVWCQMIRYFLQDIIHHLRRVCQPRCFDHMVVQSSDPFEVIFSAIVCLWTNHIKVDKLDIPNDHIQWIKIYNLIGELWKILCYTQRNMEMREM